MRSMRQTLLVLVAGAMSAIGWNLWNDGGAAAGRQAVAADTPLTAQSAPPVALQAQNPIHEDGNIKYVAVCAELPNEQARALLEKGWKENPAKKAYPFCRLGRFVDLFVQQDATGDAVLKEISDAGGWAEIDRWEIVPPPPPSQQTETKPRDQPEKILDSGGGLLGYKGKGVIIAVIDTGIHFRHDDFTNDDGTSRVLYFWDTTRPQPKQGPGAKEAAPVAYPNGAPIGTVYTREELTQDLQAKQIPAGDNEGHGTMCAGIAAGNGKGSKGRTYAGVAPQAEIVAIRISSQETGFANGYLLNAICDWLDKKAKQHKMPLVVSCSFGGHKGAHDGNLVQERHLSERFALTVPGRAICISAGNEGDKRMRSKLDLADGASKKLTWTTSVTAILNLYFDTDKIADVRFNVPPEVKSVGRLSWSLNPLTKKVTVWASVTGDGEITVSANKAVQGDAYLLSQNFKAQFDKACANRGKQVGWAGTTANAITVGSYDWNDLLDPAGKNIRLAFKREGGGDKFLDLTIGGLSDYSSPGPSRSGAVKPDIVAPGMFYTSPAIPMPANLDAKQRDLEVFLRDKTLNYHFMNGTSAATPYTAGVVALLMGIKPDLTTGDIKAEFQKLQAKTDQHTGQKLPNEDWGYGKLNKANAEQIIRTVVEKAKK
jgi:subtilisin family serine protease